MYATLNNFLQFEKENKCNKITVEGVHIWSLYRYEIFNAIQKAQGGPTTSNTVDAEGFSKNELLTMAINALKPFKYKDVDVLFIGNGRRSKNADTGVWEDIYCDELAKHYNSVILEHPEDRGHRTPNGMDNVYFTDRVAFKTNIAVKLSKKFRTIKRIHREAEIMSKFSAIFEAIKRDFDVDITDKLIEEMTDRLYYFTVTKKYCGKILDKARPKFIFEICYYTMESYAMSALGKERGIPTCEYAHGFTFPGHPATHFNPGERIPELPDAMLIFSETQKPVTSMPDNIPLVTVGFPFFEQERANYQAKFPKDKKTIVFVSSASFSLSREISRIAVDLSKHVGNEYNIIYKLHPFEYSSWRMQYPWLVGAKLTVVDNNDNHIYRYLAEASVQVGARSASIWEGIGFGCRTILLDLDDTAENMEYLIKEKQVPLAASAAEIMTLINDESIGCVGSDCIFEPNAFSNITNYIDKKIGKN